MKTSSDNTQSTTSNRSVKNDPVIKNLLSRMPKKVAESFDDEQLTNLMTAIGSRSWGNHAVDKRGTFKIPFYRWRFYYVMLIGRNHRELTRQEKRLSLVTSAILSSIFLMFCSALGLLVLYLIKSALGIDLLPGFSFGIWTWFKGLW